MQRTISSVSSAGVRSSSPSLVDMARSCGARRAQRMVQLWALTILVLAFRLLASEAVAMIERRVESYAGTRG